jgi:branched-chain amino acid transport system permease protein
LDSALLAQHFLNTAMLGTVYALVAVGFTLYFGVLDVIKFSHGDVLTLGAFTALAAWVALKPLHWPPLIALAAITLAAVVAMALLGMAIARWFVLPLGKAPPLNVLLVTLMLGTALREGVRLFYPQGANPKPFPRLLPVGGLSVGGFELRYDNALLLAAGVATIVGVHRLIGHSRLGLAIRAVAQDGETARTMGIHFDAVVAFTFGLGSALAAIAGVIDGLYYNEINFSMGLLLGVIGFSAAVVGGLGNVYGAILGGFVFAALQTIGAIALPFASAYRDVFAFAAVIALLAVRPTGLIAEKGTDRV